MSSRYDRANRGSDYTPSIQSLAVDASRTADDVIYSASKAASKFVKGARARSKSRNRGSSFDGQSEWGSTVAKSVFGFGLVLTGCSLVSQMATSDAAPLSTAGGFAAGVVGAWLLGKSSGVESVLDMGRRERWEKQTSRQRSRSRGR